MTSTSTPKATAFPPNQTLYLTNLPSAKIQKYDIKVSLYMLFSTYGPVIDVVAMKTQKMRGQAHVTFRDIPTATQAMRALQGFEFFGYKIQIFYAKNKSDTLAKLDGTFRQPSAQNQPNVETTSLQQSIFNGPPSSALFAAPSSNLPPPPGPSMPDLPTKPVLPPAPIPVAAPSQDTAMAEAPAPGSVAGVKRPREEEEEEEEDSDGDAAMEEDSDDD